MNNIYYATVQLGSVLEAFHVIAENSEEALEKAEKRAAVIFARKDHIVQAVQLITKDADKFLDRIGSGPLHDYYWEGLYRK